MIFSRLLQTTILMGIFFVLPSCAGYKMGADKPAKMAGVSTLAIPVFKNLTLEPRSSVIVTNNVIKQFQMDPTYKITDTKSADAVLKGKILKFERHQLRSVRTNVLKSRELEIKIWIEYVVDDAKTGATLMKGTAQGDTSVYLDPNFQLSERQAIDEASRKAAEEIVSRVSEGW